MSKSKILLIGLAIVTVSVTLLYTLAPRPHAGAARPEEVAGLVVRGYDEGAVVWETEAERGEIGSASGKLENVLLRLEDGATTVEVRAAELAQQPESVTLTGNVRAQTNDGLLVLSEQMAWREVARMLESGPTRLSLRGDELSADSFRYDANSQIASLAGVQASLAREMSLAASSDRGEISRDTVRLFDNVRLYSTDEDSVQTASRPTFELAADALTLSRDGVTAAGHVSADIRVAPQGDDRGT